MLRPTSCSPPSVIEPRTSGCMPMIASVSSV
jgi:hypothetical protein